MSPNKNYLRGTRFERQLVLAFKACGAHASRSAGSHGKWDVVAYTNDMLVANNIHGLFEWLSTEQPKDALFDWTCRYGSGKLERKVYIKVVHGEPDEWVYLCQCKVKS